MTKIAVRAPSERVWPLSMKNKAQSKVVIVVKEA